MRAEYERLAGLGKTERERNLVQLFIDYLNQANGILLQFACKPDAETSSVPAPDFVYEDRAAQTKAAFEITRPLVGVTEGERVQRDRFLQDAASHLPSDFRGGYAFWFGRGWRPPANPSQRGQLAQELARLLQNEAAILPAVSDDRPPGVRIAELIVISGMTSVESVAPWVLQQGLDLTSLLPGITVRYDADKQPPTLIELSRSHPWVRVASGEGETEADTVSMLHEEYVKWYREILRETDNKLRPYHEQGCETFLLFDCLTGERFYPRQPSDLANWHRWADRYASSEWAEIPLRLRDFAHIDHVIAFEICSHGVGADIMWRAPASRLKTADSWIMKPPGWHDDES